MCYTDLDSSFYYVNNSTCLLMLLHCGIYFLGEIIATMGHIGFLWVLPLTVLAFAGFLISVTLSFLLSNSLKEKTFQLALLSYFYCAIRS